MKLSSPDREDPDINLTSLIDVVLLLLVFFMITTSFVREAQISIDLPEAGDAVAGESGARPLEISVTAQGTYLVNGRGLLDSRVETLQAAIRKVADETGAKGRVVISADRNASHQSVVTAMDAAGKLGFVEMSIATVEAEGN